METGLPSTLHPPPCLPLPSTLACRPIRIYHPPTLPPSTHPSGSSLRSILGIRNQIAAWRTTIKYQPHRSEEGSGDDGESIVARSLFLPTPLPPGSISAYIHTRKNSGPPGSLINSWLF
uniref:Uncharacterized protein n=1 Tax=Morchella brunnea TaxID=1174671 RepID=A0A8K1MH98_9PEZI|nr:hypothetical protein LK370_mgp023 [Morchella brunnea]UBU98461.1 hypothetical protein [Morchella brunnea]